VQNIHIYNNTQCVSRDLDVSIFPKGRTPINSRFENNIFYFEGAGKWGEHANGINTTFRNNLYFGVMPHESDPSPVTADPNFCQPGTAGVDIDLGTMEALGGYRLTPASPCLGAGIIIDDNGGQDILGVNLISGKADIGALGQKP